MNSNNLNDILRMLDWNNDAETQQKGLQAARQIMCLSLFMQPTDAQFNKNIWDNCALIISEKEDNLLTPYLFNLLDWLQDLNWPGSLVILDRLQQYQDYEKLSIAIQNRVVIAEAFEDEIWLTNLAELLVSDKLKDKLNKHIYCVLKKHCV